MRRLLILSTIFLAACSKPASQGQMCLKGQDVFNSDSKVQLGSTSQIDPNIFYNIESIDSDIAARLTSDVDSSIVQSGTTLTAMVKTDCEEPGAITSHLVFDKAAKQKNGVRSYPFHVRADIALADLNREAKSDTCLIGLSDTSIDSVESLSADPMVSEQGQFAQLNASEAFPKFYNADLGKRPNSVIAIIDTGVDISHKDLKDNLWTNAGEIPGNGIDDDKNGYIDDVNGYDFVTNVGDPTPKGDWNGNFHGTHVAGLAAARSGNGVGGSGIAGVGAKIMALNVFGAESGAYSYNTENAIRYAADNGADVINLSLGGTSASASYKAAIQYAVSKGVTVLAAAGNTSQQISPRYFMTPGAYGSSISGMVTIGSIDSSTSEWSSFSNFGSGYVELAAPGSENSSASLGLLSTLPHNTYGRLQGTSMSAPVVSGAAALAIQLLRALGYAPTPARIENALERSGRAFAALASKVRGGETLDLNGLADYIFKYYPKLETPEAGATNKMSVQSAALLPCP